MLRIRDKWTSGGKLATRPRNTTQIRISYSSQGCYFLFFMSEHQMWPFNYRAQIGNCNSFLHIKECPKKHQLPRDRYCRAHGDCSKQRFLSQWTPPGVPPNPSLFHSPVGFRCYPLWEQFRLPFLSPRHLKCSSSLKYMGGLAFVQSRKSCYTNWKKNTQLTHFIDFPS